MSEIYFDAVEVERTRRRAEGVGRLILGDSWMRERMTPEEVDRAHGEPGRPEAALWLYSGSPVVSVGRWLAKKLLQHNLTRLNAGDLRPTLRLDANDVRFRFPGERLSRSS